MADTVTHERRASGLSLSDTKDKEDGVNASGHVQQLERQFSLLSIISVGTVVGNVWCALGSTIVSSPVIPPDLDEARY